MPLRWSLEAHFELCWALVVRLPLEIHFELFLVGSSGQHGLRWTLEIPFELKCARAVCQKGSPLGNGSKLTHNDPCQMQMTPQAWHYRWQRLLHVI